MDTLTIQNAMGVWITFSLIVLYVACGIGVVYTFKIGSLKDDPITFVAALMWPLVIAAFVAVLIFVVIPTYIYDSIHPKRGKIIYKTDEEEKNDDEK